MTGYLSPTIVIVAESDMVTDMLSGDRPIDNVLSRRTANPSNTVLYVSVHADGKTRLFGPLEINGLNNANMRN